MSDYITFHDISYAQGSYDMASDPNPLIAMKMSGFYYGSKLGYLDSQAANNYNNAIKYDKIPLLYHFAGGADPITEANYFVNAVSPLAKGDIYVLDYELTDTMNPPADPVNWCLQFVETVHSKTGVWPLLYTYASMLSEHDFSPVLQNCALWVADYSVSPDGTVPTQGHPYIIQQYTSTPIDTNALFISLDTLKKYAYGYIPATQPPTAAPTATTTTLPPEPHTSSTSSSTSTTMSTTTTTLPPVTEPSTKPTAAITWWVRLINWLKGILHG